MTSELAQLLDGPVAARGQMAEINVAVQCHRSTRLEALARAMLQVPEPPQ